MTDKLLTGVQGAAPSYMAGVGDEQDFGGGMDGNAYPRLAFKGSRFRLRNGDDEIVMKETELDVIILRDYPHISRIFFEDGYDAEGGSRPSCGSADGEHPLSTIPVPQANACATCPQNEKGSNITDDGKKTRACGFYKRLIVMIIGYEDVGPVVADMKSMTLFGDSKPGENQWTLKAYFQRLKSNNTLPFQLITRLSFDTDMSVPKVLLQPVGYVTETTFTNEVAPLVATPDGEKLLLEMSDTASMRVLGEDDEGGQMALPAGKKPAYLDAPKPQPTPASTPEPNIADQLTAAVNAGDYALAGKLQAEMEAGVAKPAKAEPSQQDIIDGMNVDLKIAVEGNDFVTAAAIQKEIAKIKRGETGGKQADAPAKPAKPAKPKVDPAKVHAAECDALKMDIQTAVAASDYELASKIQAALEGKIDAFIGDKGEDKPLTPAQKGALTRAKNKAKKEAAAKAEEEEVNTTEDPTGSEGFDEELEGALKDFGF